MVRGFRIIPDNKKEAEWEKVFQQQEKKRFLEYYLQNAAYSFSIGFFINSLSSAVNCFCSTNPRINFFSLKNVFESVKSGIDYSFAPLVRKLYIYKFQTNLNSISQYMIYTASTSIISSLISNVVTTPITNYVETNKPSMKNYVKHTIHDFCNDFGMTIGSDIGFHFIPPHDQVGGRFARNVLLFGSSLTGSTITSYPYYRYYYGMNLPSQFRNYLSSLTHLIPETIFSSAAQHCVSKLPLFK